MQHLPTPVGDDEFNLYLNVDRRQVWFYFDKADYGDTMREVSGRYELVVSLSPIDEMICMQYIKQTTA